MNVQWPIFLKAFYELSTTCQDVQFGIRDKKQVLQWIQLPLVSLHDARIGEGATNLGELNHGRHGREEVVFCGEDSHVEHDGPRVLVDPFIRLQLLHLVKEELRRGALGHASGISVCLAFALSTFPGLHELQHLLE